MNIRKKIERIIGHNPGGRRDFICPAYIDDDGKTPNWLKKGKCDCTTPKTVDKIMKVIKEEK